MDLGIYDECVAQDTQNFIQKFALDELNFKLKVCNNFVAIRFCHSSFVGMNKKLAMS
jgi:hypothetical protein